MQHLTGFALLDAWLSGSPYRNEMSLIVRKHIELPNAALAGEPTTEVVRLMRISTDEVISLNYIRAAATCGLARGIIVRRHFFHNALPPIIHKLGLQFSTMLTLR